MLSLKLFVGYLGLRCRMILCKRFSVIFGCKTLCLPATTPPQIHAGVPELSEQEFTVEREAGVSKAG